MVFCGIKAYAAQKPAAVIVSEARLCYNIKKGGAFMLTQNITFNEINKIFDSFNRKEEYLNKLCERTGRGRPLAAYGYGRTDQAIADTWNYEISKDIIREMFFKSEKFLRGLKSKGRIDFLTEDWHNNNLGKIEWPFAAMGFDGYIAGINRRADLSEREKDEIAARGTVKFRRIKDINTCRNDYIESLIVYHNSNIIPTFRHNRGLDFYINGQPFDQKVSRSVGKSFIRTYGDGYRSIALNRPELVAVSLYENQDEERFDQDPRLYIVYLDSDISSKSIERSIIETSFEKPTEVFFNFTHSNGRVTEHRTYCYVLLLHNRNAPLE